MSAPPPAARPRRPRLGFLGLGWIGRMRLAALVDGDGAEVAALADPAPSARAEAARIAPGAALCGSLAELRAHPLDGVVIATPSALHAQQALAALGGGLAAFVQKPLGRSAAECAAVIDAARRADRLLAVDWSYRHLAGVETLRARIAEGGLGAVYAVDLVFHNAYGPGRPWFRDRRRSGGGCLVDLGSHLVDLALWLLGHPRVRRVDGWLAAGGRPLAPAGRAAGGAPVEDYAAVSLELDGGTHVRLTCSWNLPAGRDAVIEAALYGTGGGAAIRNVDGSFYDFTVELHHGCRAEAIASPPDAWGGRALLAWAARLAAAPGFDPAVADAVEVARVLDAVYARCGC